MNFKSENQALDIKRRVKINVVYFIGKPRANVLILTQLYSTQAHLIFSPEVISHIQHYSKSPLAIRYIMFQAVNFVIHIGYPFNKQALYSFYLQCLF